jgi:hypothetical protein
MARKVSVGVCVLASAALFAAIAPAAQGANTWAGTWSSDFGELQLDAGGSGTYGGSSGGTMNGHVTGNVNEGTWHRNVQDPDNNTDNGTFKWTMSADGQSFSGEWHYDTGGCGSSCGWSGTCLAGECLQNSAGGGGGGGSCKGLPGPSEFLGGARADSCPGPVKFSVHTEDGFPDRPGEKDLPSSLISVEAKGSGTLTPSGSGYESRGNDDIHMITEHGLLGADKYHTFLLLQGPAQYVKKANGLRRIDFSGYVAKATGEDLCEDGPDEEWDESTSPATPFEGALAVNGDKASLRLEFGRGGCLSDKPIQWKSRNIKKASITGGKVNASG